MPIESLVAMPDGVAWPSGSTLLAVAPLIGLIVGLLAFSLVDLVRARSVRYVPKWLWALIIVLAAAPLGAVLYLLVGRDRRSALPSEPVEASDRGQAGVGGELTVKADHGGRRRDGVPNPGAPARGGSPVDRRTTIRRAAEPVVETDGLTRDYGGGGLFDVDLSVPSGSVYGLVGPNGAGKTTMLCILGGMRRADRGAIRIGVPRRRIAVCPDVSEFDSWLTAREVVEFALALNGVDAPAGGVAGALSAAGLAHDADRRVGGFSRGMMQRLGLACALVGDPRLLIFDEPTSALDPAGRAEVLDLVSGMRGDRTVIFSSHILADVQRVADTIGILRHGRLLYQGPTQELIDTHLQPRWLVRIAGDPSLLRAEFGSQPWVTRVDPAGPDAVRVEAVSIEAGERGIPAVLASRRERLVSCDPVAADLEAAFLALTSR